MDRKLRGPYAISKKVCFRSALLTTLISLASGHPHQHTTVTTNTTLTILTRRFRNLVMFLSRVLTLCFTAGWQPLGRLINSNGKVKPTISGCPANGHSVFGNHRDIGAVHCPSTLHRSNQCTQGSEVSEAIRIEYKSIKGYQGSILDYQGITTECSEH